ncbi:hypothetical protein ACJW30_06G222900 [Castanea mollissima]
MDRCLIATMTLIFAFQRFPKMPQFWNSNFIMRLIYKVGMSKFSDVLPFKYCVDSLRVVFNKQIKINKSPSKLTIFTDPTKKTNQNPPINSKSQQHKQRNSMNFIKTQIVLSVKKKNETIK